MKKIMVAIDGSENAKKIIEYGMDIAKGTESDVYAVYVVSNEHADIARRDLGFAKAIEQHLAQEGKSATEAVEEVGKELGIKVESVLLEGKPAEKIIDYAEENDFDLIVMGTKGMTGVKKFLIGSVAENVIRHSNVPVLVVR